MNDWNPIETAPRDGTLVRLRSPKHGQVNALWHWDYLNDRWVTRIPGMMGILNATWDENDQQPTEWQNYE